MFQCTTLARTEHSIALSLIFAKNFWQCRYCLIVGFNKCFGCHLSYENVRVVHYQLGRFSYYKLLWAPTYLYCLVLSNVGRMNTLKCWFCYALVYNVNLLLIRRLQIYLICTYNTFSIIHFLYIYQINDCGLQMIQMNYWTPAVRML